LPGQGVSYSASFRGRTAGEREAGETQEPAALKSRPRSGDRGVFDPTALERPRCRVGRSAGSAAAPGRPRCRAGRGAEAPHRAVNESANVNPLVHPFPPSSPFRYRGIGAEMARARRPNRDRPHRPRDRPHRPREWPHRPREWSHRPRDRPHRPRDRPAAATRDEPAPGLFHLQRRCGLSSIGPTLTRDRHTPMRARLEVSGERTGDRHGPARVARDATRPEAGDTTGSP